MSDPPLFDIEFKNEMAYLDLIAQTHGYMGAIIYDDRDGPLIPIGSISPSDIEISSGLFILYSIVTLRHEIICQKRLQIDY